MADSKIAQHAVPGRIVGHPWRLFECVVRKEMYLKQLCDSEIMGGVSLSMGEVIIHRITRGSQQFSAAGNFQMLPGDRLLFSAAKQSDVRIKVDEQLWHDLIEKLIWANDNLEFSADVQGVSRSLDQRRGMDDRYAITRGSIITRVDTEEDQVSPQCFHERLSQHVPIDAWITVSFDPLDRFERHVNNIVESQQIALWNQVKLIQEQNEPSRVGPDTDMLPGLDFLRNTGLPLTFQLDDQNGIVSLVGPTTQVSQSSAKFLIFCDAYPDLSLLCRRMRRSDPDEEGSPLHFAALNVFRLVRIRTPQYAPCLQDFACDVDQNMANVLLDRSLWSPVPFGPTANRTSAEANLRRDLDELMATYEGMTVQVRCQILNAKLEELQTRAAPAGA